MMINWLRTVPYTQRLILLIVVVGLIWAGFYAIVWQPTTNEIETLTVKVQHLQQEIERQKVSAAELAKLESKLQNRMSQRPFPAAFVALGSEPFRHRKEVMDIAGEHKVSLTFWQTGKIEKSHEEEGVRTVHIRGRLEGGYHQIAQCLTRVLQLPWAIKVNQLRLRVSNDMSKGESLLSADFQLVSLVHSQL